MPSGMAARAASRYFWTLKVENCGASGMPIICAAPAALNAAIASRMNGVQFRIPTATGISGPRRRCSSAPCSSVMEVRGDRPPIAS